MQFVRNVADNYLESEQREIRLEAVATCCHLLRPIFSGLGQRPNQAIQHQQNHQLTHQAFRIVSKVLSVCVTDTGKQFDNFTLKKTS